MKKQTLSILATWMAASSSFAATEHMVWGEPTESSLSQFQHSKSATPKGLSTGAGSQADYQLKLKNTPNKTRHARYQIYYKGIPVWGHQLVFHNKNGSKEMVTGNNITGIEKDIQNLQPALSKQQAEAKILSTVKESIKYKSINTVIFIDDEQKAHLAYHLAFYTDINSIHIKSPNYIIDANSGVILKDWDNAHHEKVGQGLGGNAFPLPYRTGMYQHGDALPGLPSLGKFDVNVQDGRCMVETPAIRVMSLKNAELGYNAFPISIQDEKEHNLQAFSYSCGEDNLFLNYADDTSGPVNYSFSPINDTMYFASQTLEMYKQLYQTPEALGDDLPLRAFTHLGAMDNAFAIPTIREDGRVVAHQQIVIGNGEFFLTAPAQAVIAHELSHNVTELNSGLFYEGQSGGINESFSDMAAIALQDYIRREYPWYWDGKDWTIGREAMIGGVPLRYMDEPTKDGRSISHASNYRNNMNVHYSSGVFNKAFYLLAHKPGFTVQEAFQLMVDANKNYWSPIAYFDFAACGVIQAAVDRKMNKRPVIEAFAEVGVSCPMHKK